MIISWFKLLGIHAILYYFYIQIKKNTLFEL
jgi:hypothetical protein